MTPQTDMLIKMACPALLRVRLRCDSMSALDPGHGMVAGLA